MDAYYDRRAPEYDDWYVGSGLFARRPRPGWEEDLAALEATVAALPAARTLDVACGTGWLTRHLAGPVTGLDQSAAMLAIARERVPEAELVQGDGLALPFAAGAFERVFTGHFYGHLLGAERSAFLAEARRVARELVVVDAAERPGEPPEAWQERKLRDGSRHPVYKRFFRPDDLVRELGGGRVLHAGPWFVVVATP
jgi:demethylmenaquinone methyltransferase/2-methoxy-6-polyprenyl-1,4-benzoquinol methylase